MTAALPRKTCELLLVDDDVELRESVARNLTRIGYRVTQAETLNSAVELLKSQEISVAVVDLMLPDGSGIELLEKLNAGDPDETAIIMLSGHGTINSAVEAMKLGAADFLTKPVRLPELDAALQRVLEKVRLQRENKQLKALLKKSRAEQQMIGESPQIQELKRLIARVAPTDKPVMIQGESGTGKELVARAIAEQSLLSDQPMVTVNCAALPETLLESELFGHEKGAFTGAQAAKPGLFEVADGGTLFIDEVGELAPSLQAKLLRVLEDGSLRRVGSIKHRHVKVRLLAATNRDLAVEVAAGRFREDLFYRINVLTLTLPPLREREGDLPQLVHYFAGPEWELEPGLLDKLAAYSWPGNVRQLKNAIERARILATGRLLAWENFPPEVRADQGAVRTQATDGGAESPRTNENMAETSSTAISSRLLSGSVDLEEANRQLVLHAYQTAQGNKSLAAKKLGVTRRTFYRLLEKYGIAEPDEDAANP